MPAAIHNFYIEQGSNFDITFQYLDVNSAPVDLSNYCALLRLKTNEGIIYAFSSSVIGAKTPNYNLTIDSNGNILFSLPYTTTRNFRFSSAVYDLYISQSSDGVEGQQYRLSTGSISIIANNFPECPNDSLSYCNACENITGSPIQNEPPTITSTVPIVTPTLSSPAPEFDDLCALVCGDLDLYAVVYSGLPINIPDNGIASGIISINDSRIVQNIEISIQGLRHSQPSDLSFILQPPQGDKILLSAHNKMANYQNGFSYVFSNKAIPGIYINNCPNNSYVNILDKTNIYNYNEEPLLSSLNSLYGTTPSGNWSLIIKDDDIGTSGSIDRWNIIATYYPPDVDEEYVTPTPTPTRSATPTPTITQSITPTRTP